MTYHTNHCWCSESNWNNKNFDGEVIVNFKKCIDNDFISSYEHKIENPDFENLTITEEFFDEQKHLDLVESFKENFIPSIEEKKGVKLTEEELNTLFESLKKSSIKETITLKPEVIDWLNENIQDKKDTNENTPLEDRKAWAIGNASYASHQSYSMDVFFERQADALKFIRKFSIFKDPTFYFDYFNDERGNLSTNKIFDILEEHNIKVDRENFVPSSRDDVTYVYDNLLEISDKIRLLNWDKDDDEISYSKDEIKSLFEELNAIDDEDDKNFIGIGE